MLIYILFYYSQYVSETFQDWANPERTFRARHYIKHKRIVIKISRSFQLAHIAITRLRAGIRFDMRYVKQRNIQDINK